MKQKYFISVLIAFVSIFIVQTANAALINVTGEVGHYDGNGNQTSWNYLFPYNQNGGLIPTSRGLAGPVGSCVNTHTHYLFVGDTYNKRILAFGLDANNIPNTTVATYVFGQPDLNYEAMSTTTAGNNFNSNDFSMDIRCDSVNDRIFVADDSNNRVMVFDVSLAHISNYENASYIIGQTSSTTSASNVTQSTFSAPDGLAYDPDSQRLFVADSSNNRVLVFNVQAGANLNATSAINVIGASDYVTNTGGTSSTTLSAPMGMDYSTTTKQLFVADNGNNRVAVYSAGTTTIANNMAATAFLGQVSGTGSLNGNTANRFRSVAAVSYDPVGKRLFVADQSNNNRIAVFDGSAGFSNNQSAVNVLGNSVFGITSKGTTQSVFDTPSGVFYDYTSSRLYVADSNNSRIMVFTAPVGSLVNGMNASYAYGHADVNGNPVYTSSYANNYPNQRSTYNPHGIAIDTVNHRMFLSDYGDRLAADHIHVGIRAIDVNNLISATTTGLITNILGWADAFTAPTGNAVTAYQMGALSGGVAYDSTNQRLFVADNSNNRVMVFDVSTSTITDRKNADYFIGQTSSTTNASATTINGLSKPGALAYDSGNMRLFVADDGNHRVLVYNVATGTNLTNISAVNVLGQANFTSGTATTTQSGLNLLQGTTAQISALGFDSVSQRLFVPDGGNNRVLVFNVATSTISNGELASHVLGQANYTASSSATTRNGLNYPAGAEYDSQYGRLFVADSYNNRVMVFDASTSTIADGASAQAVIGQDGFTSALTRSAGQNGNGQSISGYFDTLNNAYFNVEYYPDRVTLIRMVHITTSSLPSGQTGVAYSSAITSTSTQGVSQSFSIVSGSLPSGMSLNSSNGSITGTSLTSGSYPLVIQENDNFSDGSTFFDRASLSINLSGNNIVLPSVTSSVASGVSTSTFTLNGSITNDGGASTTVRGFAWGTNPSLSGGDTATTTEAGTFGVSTFTSSISGLTPNTTYYFRAYSSNLAGTSTGTILSTATVAIVINSSVAPQPNYIATPSGSVSSQISNLVSMGNYSLANLLASQYGLKTQTNSISSTKTVPTSSSIRSLSQGDVGIEIKQLQKYLNAHGFTVSASGAGSSGHETNVFGPATKKALIKFQNAHKKDILEPQGLKSATGIFGPATRAYINGL